MVIRALNSGYSGNVSLEFRTRGIIYKPHLRLLTRAHFSKKPRADSTDTRKLIHQIECKHKILKKKT